MTAPTEVVSETDLCRISANVVAQLESHNLALHQTLKVRRQNSLDDADRVIIELSSGTAQARAARFQLQAACNEQRIEFHKLSREDIGALLWLTVEAVSRALAEFTRSGWLMEDGRFFQVGPAALGRIATIS